MLDIHNNNKQKEDEKAFYGGSRFEMICNHENEDDPKTSNGYFCKVLCGLCEEGGECCIATHLGCDTSGWAVNDQSSFLRGDLGDEPGFKPECEHGCPKEELEQSLGRLLTKVGLNK